MTIWRRESTSKAPLVKERWNRRYVSWASAVPIRVHWITRDTGKDVVVRHYSSVSLQTMPVAAPLDHVILPLISSSSARSWLQKTKLHLLWILECKMLLVPVDAWVGSLPCVWHGAVRRKLGNWDMDYSDMSYSLWFTMLHKHLHRFGFCQLGYCLCSVIYWPSLMESHPVTKDSFCPGLQHILRLNECLPVFLNTSFTSNPLPTVFVPTVGDAQNRHLFCNYTTKLISLETVGIRSNYIKVKPLLKQLNKMLKIIFFWDPKNWNIGWKSRIACLIRPPAMI